QLLAVRGIVHFLPADDAGEILERGFAAEHIMGADRDVRTRLRRNGIRWFRRRGTSELNHGKQQDTGERERRNTEEILHRGVLSVGRRQLGGWFSSGYSRDERNGARN